LVRLSVHLIKILKNCKQASPITFQTTSLLAVHILFASRIRLPFSSHLGLQLELKTVQVDILAMTSNTYLTVCNNLLDDYTYLALGWQSAQPHQKTQDCNKTPLTKFKQ
jgi:hypothetical protein